MLKLRLAAINLYPDAFLKRFAESPRAVLCFLLFCSVALRLPFYFLSVDLRALARSLTVHEEAFGLLMGQDVLSGHLPYLQHWHATVPALWYAYALVAFFSFGKLLLVRVLASLYLAVAAFVLYRACARNHMYSVGVWAAWFFIVFASFLPGGQSLIPEIITALPFTAMLYFLFQPQINRRCLIFIALFYSACVSLSPSFLFILPGLSLLLAFQCPVSAFVPLYAAKIAPSWKGRAFDATLSSLIYSLVLIAPAVAFHFALFLLYYFNERAGFFLRGLYFSIFSIGEGWSAALSLSPINFASSVANYTMMYASSRFWLIPFLICCYVVRLILQLRYDRASVSRIEKYAVVLMVSALLETSNRQLFSQGPLNYMTQILPLATLFMARALHYRWRDAWIFLMFAVVLGTSNIAKPSGYGYTKLMQSNDARPFNYIRFNDQSYQLSRIINVVPHGPNDLVVCGDNPVLYMLTRTTPPNYYLPMYMNIMPSLQVKAGRRVTDLKTLTTRVMPYFIIRQNGPVCASLIDDAVLLNYRSVYQTKNYTLFIRNDRMDRL